MKKTIVGNGRTVPLRAGNAKDLWECIPTRGTFNTKYKTLAKCMHEPCFNIHIDRPDTSQKFSEATKASKGDCLHAPWSLPWCP